VALLTKKVAKSIDGLKTNSFFFVWVIKRAFAGNIKTLGGPKIPAGHSLAKPYHERSIT
jgi:hypothetical protein